MAEAKIMMLGAYELNQIYTGDCRGLAKAIPDESIDMVLTDPPFGIGFKYENYKDTDSDSEYTDFICWLIEQSNRIIKPGGLCFVFQAQPQLRLTWPLFPASSRIFAACKNFVQMRPTPVQFAYDPVIFWQKPGRLLPKYNGRDYHIASTSITNSRGANEAGWHECPRPLDTCQYIVQNFSPASGIVCDFFMGSGTTAVAARTMGRQYIGFEIRDAIADKARQRVALTQPPLLVADATEQMAMELA